MSINLRPGFVTNYLKSAQLTVYTTERNKLMRGWILIPQDDARDADLLMYNKFWKTDGIGHNNMARFP